MRYLALISVGCGLDPPGDVQGASTSESLETGRISEHVVALGFTDKSGAPRDANTRTPQLGQLVCHGTAPATGVLISLSRAFHYARTLAGAKPR